MSSKNSKVQRRAELPDTQRAHRACAKTHRAFARSGNAGLYAPRCCVSGRFVLERHLKKGSILISIEDNTVYQVRGIKSSWEEMFFYMQPPIMIVATLLPYRGIIISDGLVSSMPLSFGGGIKKTFRDQYNSAKTRKQIITSLPSAAGC